MMIYESLGYTPESGEGSVVIGYYVMNSIGFYCFVTKLPVPENTIYDIVLSEDWPWIRAV